jgi:hypothetical protein
MSRLLIVIGATAATGLLFGCGDRAVSESPGDVSTRLDSVSQAEWAALGSRRVFFAHQSVGGNVVQGVEALLRERPALGLRLVRSSQPDTIVGGAIIHDYVGENGAPASKTEGFGSIVNATMQHPIEVGMQKFCYADFNKHTDPAAFFATYEQSIEALRRLRPNLQIVHVTAPLLEKRFALKDVARAVLGKTTTEMQTAKVRAFNDLLRARYGKVDPVFDLAAVESTGQGAGGDHAAESLAAQFATPDGGHLNDLGQRVVAAELLVFLAKLPSPDTAQ